MGHSRVAFAIVQERVLVRNQSNGIVLRQHVHFVTKQAHFHLEGFVQGLVLEQRHKARNKHFKQQAIRTELSLSGRQVLRPNQSSTLP